MKHGLLHMTSCSWLTELQFSGIMGARQLCPGTARRGVTMLHGLFCCLYTDPNQSPGL